LSTTFDKNRRRGRESAGKCVSRPIAVPLHASLHYYAIY
jgi:hypothetical protein